MLWIALIAVAVGVFMDGLTLFLNLRHIIRGYGPSGVPVVPLVLYALGIALVSPILTSFEVREWLGIALLFHLSCQLLIAWLVYGVLWMRGWHPRARSRDAQTDGHDPNK
jgi:hypothetical protein